MYRKGDVGVEIPDPYFDQDYDSTVSDARNRGGSPLKFPYVALPHSCGDWVIGSVEEIDLMIADLQQARGDLVLAIIEAGNPKEA